MTATNDSVSVTAVSLSEFSLDGLDPALHQYIDWHGPRGPMFDHPLHRDLSMRMTAAIPANWHGDDDPAGLAIITDIVAKTQTMVDEYERKGNWRGYVFAHERPYRVDALLSAIRKVGTSRLWRLVGDVWTDSESNAQSSEQWEEIWSHAYDSSGKFRKGLRRIMGAKDLRVYDSLPELLTAYRGCFDDYDIWAYSWTLDETKAEWFANRKRGSGSLSSQRSTFTNLASSPISMNARKPKSCSTTITTGLTRTTLKSWN